MVVRSPLLTSHKWRELVSSERLVCRCHGVFLWCYVCFVLFRFRLYAIVETAALCSTVLRHAGVPIATRVFFLFFFFCLFEDVAFSEYFFVPFPLSLCMDSTSYVLSFRMVFFYFVTTGWVLTSANVRIQSIKQKNIVRSAITAANLYWSKYCEKRPNPRKSFNEWRGRFDDSVCGYATRTSPSGDGTT